MNERERVNERGKESAIILIGVGLKNYICFLDVCYSAHLKIDVHCSKSAKNFNFASTAANALTSFFSFFLSFSVSNTPKPTNPC